MHEAHRATSMLDAQGTSSAPAREGANAAMGAVAKLCNLAFEHCVVCRDAPCTPR
ncbi:MAG: hypothetical protein OEP95_01575 [Myxococcales bacterium]|nr:hypothetical protein [Myxococcales bacterium]